MNRKFTLLALILFCNFLLTNAQIDIQYNLKLNDSFIIEQETTQNITQNILGTEQKIKSVIKGTINFKVTGVSERSYVLDASFSSLVLKMTSEGLGTLMEYSTESEEETVENNIFKSIINVPIKISINKYGKVLDVYNGDVLVDRMISSLNLTDETVIQQMRASLGKDWSGDTLGNSFEQILFYCPEKSVSVGDTWNNKFVSENALNSDNTWKLDELSDANYSISGNANIRLNTKTPDVTMDAKGTQTTDLIIDSTTGMLIKMVVTNKAEGVSSVQTIPDAEIPIVIETSSIYIMVD